MSFKSIVQIIIVLIIFIILGGVYIKYFSKEKIEVDKNIEQTEKKTQINSIIKKSNQNNQGIVEGEEKLANSSNLSEIPKVNKEKIKKEPNKNLKQMNNEIPNLVKDVEYLTTDKNGNNYKILASSGKTNINNKNILDLDNVRGEITSDERPTIYILSDFAEYNSSNLGSNFIKNVVINYEDKQITCDNFDINMETGIAIAYNNVVVTNPNSIMKASMITLDIETKEININPEGSKKSKVKIKTNQ
tara:strand:+ start:269 stop:1006 length:738 start_codon:yes stop_codon:yes gene_type:complete